ncbi:GGDEF domain-containing protein [Thiomicrorhabdus sp. Milos-T2]|uniref:bifunctional diguanylate cyclase/phosphodiesterase n=1 Tax=Thiomicrorhabdus sp. Milos-T2 TaxID=90814 RepID=UPI000494A6E9|nr:GGDEF domain-containing protein [Thiomicrorhabdus sp. Milos-T2]
MSPKSKNTSDKDTLDKLLIGDETCPIPKDDFLSTEQLEHLYGLQREVLESIALEQDTQKTLDKLCIMAENLVPNAIASIMLLNSNDVLNVKAAPSLPPEGILTLNGLKPGPFTGSCGNVIYQKMPVFVTNTQNDKRWDDLQNLVKEFHLGACWSMPVCIKQGEIIGTFALSSFEERVPTLFHRRVLDVCAYIVGIVLKREAQETKLDYLAYYDVLTGIKNRASLVETLEKRVNQEKAFYLLQLGLDRFKIINDSYGHKTGDSLLKKISTRIEQYFLNEDAFFRISGDEFVLLFNPNMNREELNTTINELSNIITSPYIIDEREFNLTASIGVTRFEPRLNNGSELLKETDMAMTIAKSEVNNPEKHVCFLFDEEIRESIKENIWLETELKLAIRQEAFELYYQPIMSSDGQDIVYMEALIRWRHPEKGFIPPDSFIPLAEEIGVISKITNWVVSQAITDLKRWHEQGFRDFKVAINLSGLEFTTQHISQLIALIEAAKLTDYIDFEMTERYLMDKDKKAINLLQQIRQSGIGLSLDDFGTGFSSLSYLKTYPINKIKIDQSLIRDITEDKNDLAITTAIIALSNCLDLTIVAEGVETKAHCDLLQNLGVDLLQGYYFSRPIPFEEMTEKLKINKI